MTAFIAAFKRLLEWMIKKTSVILKNTQDIKYYGGFQDF